jgi:hypothetical protein
MNAINDPRVLRMLEMIDLLPDVGAIQRTGGGHLPDGGSVQGVIIALRADAMNLRRFPDPVSTPTHDGGNVESTPAPPVFVRFSCDCIGILDGQDVPIVVQRCDNQGDDNSFGFARRDMCGADGPKSYTPLTPEQTTKLIGVLDRYVQDGHRFRAVRALLGLGHER